MTTHLVLVRHGQTTANAEGRLLGRADVALTDTGRAQATAVAAALAGLPVVKVVSSPLARAADTAAAFGVPVETDERWIEMDYGTFDRQLLTDVPARVWDQWRADLSYCPPGGETLRDLFDRVTSACASIAEEDIDGTVVVVTHVSPIKAAIAWALGVGPEVAWRMFVDVASVSRIVLAAGRPPVLQTFNETPWRPVAGRAGS